MEWAMVIMMVGGYAVTLVGPLVIIGMLIVMMRRVNYLDRQLLELRGQLREIHEDCVQKPPKPHENA